MDEIDFFRSRIDGLTYISREFSYNRPNSRDIGSPARNINQVFDCFDIDRTIDTTGKEWSSKVMTLGNRRQIKICIAKEAGHYKDLVIQEFNPRHADKLKNVLTLQGEQVNQFISSIHLIESISPEGELSRRVDSVALQRLLKETDTLEEAYRQEPDSIRNLVENDPDAKDVKAVKARKEAVKRFEKLLEDSDYMDSARSALGKNGNKAKPEAVWQDFFEHNQWILGAGLGAPLFTAFNPGKLETVVKGKSFNSVGKRTDALYTTSGIVKSFVFAEIKRPDTQLLEVNQYRSGTWSISKELSGGIAQVHTTVQLTEDELNGHVKRREDEEGNEMLSDEVYLFRPRAYLVIGSTKEFQSDSGGRNPSEIRSFELFRSSIMTPEIITYDELLAKARWLAYSDEEQDESEMSDNEPEW